MIALLEEALQAGALGLSSGLFTPPGSYAEPDEMIALGHVLKRHNARLLHASSRRIEQGASRQSRRRSMSPRPAACMSRSCISNAPASTIGARRRVALKMIAAAKARGVDVDCDSYPYAAGSNPLKNLLPQWVQEGGVAAMLGRLKAPETRVRIRADIARDGLNNWGRIADWDCVQISISPHLPQNAGLTIADLARERSADPIDIALRLSDRGPWRDARAGHLDIGGRHS